MSVVSHVSSSQVSPELLQAVPAPASTTTPPVSSHAYTVSLSPAAQIAKPSVDVDHDGDSR